MWHKNGKEVTARQRRIAVVFGKGRRPGKQELSRLVEHLASLVEAGLPLSHAVAHLQEHPWSRAESEWLTVLHTAVEEGRPLSDAWLPVAPKLLTTLMAAGEATGNLAATLRAWSVYVRARRRTVTDLLRTVSYPLLLTALMTALLVFVSRVVLPMFAGVYSQLGLHPTGAAGAVAYVLTALPGWLGWLAGCAGLAAVTAGVVRRVWPSAWGRVSARMPGTKLRRLSRTHTWSQLLSLHIEAGIALTDTLVRLSDPGGPRWLREVSEQTLHKVLAGEPLAQAFSGEWDPLFPVLLRWAEQTGELGSAFARIETYAEELLQARLKRLVEVLEPAVLLVMGALVCASMYVVYVPMYQMITAISKGT